MKIVGVGPLDLYSHDLARAQGPARDDIDFPIDLGRIAFRPAYRLPWRGLIDDDRKPLADFVLELARADDLRPLHEAPVARLLLLRVDKRKAEIVRRGAMNRFVFEGPDAVELG